jgi:plasmid stabilization system protein ParE
MRGEGATICVRGTEVSRQYLIFYQVMEPGVRIGHVVHGRRDISALFEP